MKLPKLKDVVIILLLGLVVWSLVRGERNYKRTLKGLRFEITKTRDDLGAEISKTQVIQGDLQSLRDLGEVVKDQDSLLALILQRVNRNTPSGTASQVITSSRDTLLQVQVVRVDTVREDSLVYLWPVFQDSLEDRWISLKVRAGIDTILTDLKVRNDFETWTSWEKRGLFKEREPVVYWRNLNPYTETLQVRSYTVPKHKQKRGLWFLAGMGVGAGLTFGAYQLSN